MFKPCSNYYLLTVPRRCFFCGPLLLFTFHVYLCYAALSFPCILVITCWERADLLALLCVMFSCVCVHFPYGVSAKVWYLIVSIPDLYQLLYSDNNLGSHCFDDLGRWDRLKYFRSTTWALCICDKNDMGSSCFFFQTFNKSYSCQMCYFIYSDRVQGNSNMESRLIRNSSP